jgi:hypothetical protein
MYDFVSLKLQETNFLTEYLENWQRKMSVEFLQAKKSICFKLS